MTNAIHTQVRALALVLLLVAALAALSGCTATRSNPSPQDGDVTAAGRLDRVGVPRDSRVFVDVYGYDDAVCEDTADLIAAVLQSDVDLLIADTREEAEYIVEVKIQDVYLSGEGSGRVSASEALGNTAIGTVLGLGVGAVVGGRTGAAVGAGLGAAAGIGATVYDAGTETTWILAADVSIGSVYNMPDLQEHDVSITGRDLDRETCLPGLKEQLAQDIAAAIRRR